MTIILHLDHMKNYTPLFKWRSFYTWNIWKIIHHYLYNDDHFTLGTYEASEQVCIVVYVYTYTYLTVKRVRIDIAHLAGQSGYLGLGAGQSHVPSLRLSGQTGQRLGHLCPLTTPLYKNHKPNRVAYKGSWLELYDEVVHGGWLILQVTYRVYMTTCPHTWHPFRRSCAPFSRVL